MARFDLDLLHYRTGQVAREDVAEFNAPVRDVNWGIWHNDRLIALFQAEDDGDGYLAVHANVKRRSLHPVLAYAFAYTFSTDLLRQGAVGLKAEIDLRNKAAIRMAKKAGYTEVSRNDDWVILRR